MAIIREFLRHFGETQHFKNIIYFMLAATLCTMILRKLNLPDKFWDLMLVITGYYFGSRNVSVGNANDRAENRSERREDKEQ